MSNIEQFYKNCKIFREQLTQIEHHIKTHNIYTAFDFARLHSGLTVSVRPTQVRRERLSNWPG